MFTNTTNVNTATSSIPVPDGLPSAITGNFVSEFSSRKNTMKQNEETIASCTARLESFPKQLKEKEKSKRDLKTAIKTLKTDNKNESLSELASRIAKIAAVFTGYLVLGSITLTLAPIFMECSSQTFSKLCHGKFGGKIVKKKRELANLKDAIVSLKANNESVKGTLALAKLSLETNSELHKKNISLIKGSIEELKVSQQLLRQSQTYLAEQIAKEHESLIFQTTLATTSKDLSLNMKAIEYLNNLITP